MPEAFDDSTTSVYWGPGGGLRDRVEKYASPGLVWDQLAADWNTMAINEPMKRFEKELTIDLVADLPEPDGQTVPRKEGWFRMDVLAKATPSTMSAATVSAIVKRYRITAKEGTALVVIADRFAKSEDRGCVWPTLFDVASREVLATRQECHAPGGLEFRNYWFRPVVDAMEVFGKAAKAGRL